ncbi:TetR family transcriptional regulator [Klebsiella pneumoniae subsp. pneumoniae]|uniref:TetR/AcrR family transcriptional regulator n=1 Tax=Klebsiella pneumoniae TaxID=573 RepID=UPI0010A7B2B0|nr:TetR family transcriptional regulator [Klebsiella pneumoniae subsp. pneumoniae]
MNPNTSTVLKPRRGRPPKVDRQFDDTRQALIRSGLEVLTETGYLAAGIDAVIKNIAVPKGSFYHCFKSKEAFGLAVLAAYGDFFAHKLDKFLLNDAVPPLERMAAFVRHAGFYPLCFPNGFLFSGGFGLGGGGGGGGYAPAAGAIASDASPQALAQVFWIGWEGAVMRARLVQSAAPLNQYWDFFAHSMTTKTPAQDGASADNPLPTRNTLS